MDFESPGVDCWLALSPRSSFTSSFITVDESGGAPLAASGMSVKAPTLCERVGVGAALRERRVEPSEVLWKGCPGRNMGVGPCGAVPDPPVTGKEGRAPHCCPGVNVGAAGLPGPSTERQLVDLGKAVNGPVAIFGWSTDPGIPPEFPWVGRGGCPVRRARGWL